MSLLDKASLIVTPNAYKESKLYSVVPSSGAGDMNVVRATTATRVNSAGLIESVAVNVPRIDYTNGSCPSLLVEPQRTNLFINSNDIIASEGGTVNSNVFTSPDGTQNSDQFIVSNANTYHSGVRDIVGTAGTNYNVSLFVKAGTGRYFLFRAMTNSYATRFGITVDLQTGTILQTNSVGSPTNTSAKIENYGNGWYRLSLSMASIGVQYGIVWSASNVANPTLDAFLDYTYAGNGTDSYYIWGFQMEQGSYATSLIPTQGSSVTRNADVISKTGISSLIGQTEGTVFIKADNKILGQTNRTLFYVSDATANNYITVNYSAALADTIRFFVVGNAALGALGFFVYTAPILKLAVTYKNGVYKLFINGSLIYTQTGNAFNANLESLFVGTNRNLNEPIGERIESLQLYKTELTNAECIALTTL
jgi:hypothetical protein